MAAVELLSHAPYVRALRSHLDPALFIPSSRHLWRIAPHAGLLLGGSLLLRGLPLPAAPLCALLIGHSTAYLGFLAHDVSNHAVVRHRAVVRVLELLLFGVNLIPPTVWRRVHNQTHHAETNTVRDPDRPFLARSAP